MLVKTHSQREKKFTEYVNRIKTVEKTETIYEDLYKNLTENLEITKADLGEYFLNEYLFVIKDSFAEIDEKIIFYLGLFYGEESKDLKAFHFYKPRLEKRINDLLGEPQQPDNVKFDNIETKHDPNLWNAECYNLFKYLFDNYYKGTKRQLTNIWFYLKEIENPKYILNATKEMYIPFILENYEIKITNFDKAQTKWEDKESRKLNEHRQNYEDSLKQIAENVKNT